MKIAFVGKGGSGKSSVSWLAVKTLEDMGSKVLAIDADHNMDLTSNLGLDPEKTPLMHKTDKEFMEKVGLADGEFLISLVRGEKETLPMFTTSPLDPYTASVATKINESTSLINLGLGSPDVLYKSMCAHGLSGPLKYYLGLLDEKDDFVVVDSVAGTDMLNYGLYAGIDAVIGVVEPHRNSVKVFEQIKSICRKVGIPCRVIINKPAQNEFYTSFVNSHHDIILGEVPHDIGVVNYDYANLSLETKNEMRSILEKIKGLKKRGNLQSIKDFQTVKSSH